MLRFPPASQQVFWLIRCALEVGWRAHYRGTTTKLIDNSSMRLKCYRRRGGKIPRPIVMSTFAIDARPAGGFELGIKVHDGAFVLVTSESDFLRPIGQRQGNGFRDVETLFEGIADDLLDSFQPLPCLLDAAYTFFSRSMTRDQPLERR